MSNYNRNIFILTVAFSKSTKTSRFSGIPQQEPSLSLDSKRSRLPMMDLNEFGKYFGEWQTI